VKSIESITYENYRVLIVDNKSTNDSEAILRNSLPGYEILQTGENLGFAGGNNFGTRYALKEGADHVLLLNNDTLVTPCFLSEMVNTMVSDEKIGAVSCKIMYESERDIIWYAGGTFKWNTINCEHYGMKEKDTGKFDEIKEVDFITGCAILLRKELLSEIGMLPEQYFMCFEDMDYSVMIRDSSFKMMYNPNGVIYHKVSKSSGGEESPFGIKWFTRNRIIFLFKYKKRLGRLKFIKSLMFIYFSRGTRIAQFYLKGDRDRAKATIEGLREGMRIAKSK
jgi:GT2 family glycosyltransferase